MIWRMDMENKELGKWLAENVMGWKWESAPTDMMGTDVITFYRSEEGRFINEKDWHPTEDHNQIYQCEESLDEKQKIKYLTVLCPDWDEQTNTAWGDLWNLVHATPLQRAQAIYKALT